MAENNKMHEKFPGMQRVDCTALWCSICKPACHGVESKQCQVQRLNRLEFVNNRQFIIDRKEIINAILNLFKPRKVIRYKDQSILQDCRNTMPNLSDLVLFH